METKIAGSYNHNQIQILVNNNIKTRAENTNNSNNNNTCETGPVTGLTRSASRVSRFKSAKEFFERLSRSQLEQPNSSSSYSNLHQPSSSNQHHKQHQHHPKFITQPSNAKQPNLSSNIIKTSNHQNSSTLSSNRTTKITDKNNYTTPTANHNDHSSSHTAGNSSLSGSNNTLNNINSSISSSRSSISSSNSNSQQNNICIDITPANCLLSNDCTSEVTSSCDNSASRELGEIRNGTYHKHNNVDDHLTRKSNDSNNNFLNHHQEQEASLTEIGNELQEYEQQDENQVQEEDEYIEEEEEHEEEEKDCSSCSSSGPFNNNDKSDLLPTNVLFKGDNVIIGSGSLLIKRNKQLKIKFDEANTLTFEYPSEGM